MSLSVSIASTKQDREICFHLRHEVFVVEQDVPEDMELDEHDETDAVHFLGYAGTHAVAAARIVMIEYSAKIGRMVVVKNARGNNFGVEMMQVMIDYAKKTPDCGEVVLDAQIQATAFYERLGFTARGNEFMDAGITHIHMVRQL